MSEQTEPTDTTPEQNVRIVQAHEIATGWLFQPIGKPLTKEEIAVLNTSESIEIVEHRTSGPGIWRDQYMSMIFVTHGGEKRLYIAALEGGIPDQRVYER